jgi:hypothetical protein
MERNVRRTKAQPKPVVKTKKVEKACPKRVVVTVFRDEKGECRVDPREACVRPGGTVAFRSKVGPLTVFVPTPGRAADLFPRTRGPLFGVPARGKTLTVSVAKGKEPIVYTYSVYCRKDKAFARASFPRIIVV